MSSLKNYFEREATLMSTKQYYRLRGRNKNTHLISGEAGGGGGAAVDLFS